ncbi:MAG: hypothetical protein K6L81_08200 [Agarilytica sp.]
MHYFIIAISVVLVCSGCASSIVYEPLLAGEDLKGVQKINVVHIVNQKNIEAQFSPARKVGLTAGVAGGGVGFVIGSIVDAAMAVRSTVVSRNERSRVAPFKEMLIGYDAENVGEKAIRKSFDESKYSIGDYTTLYDVKPKTLDINKYVDDFSHKKLLTIKTEYSFDPFMNSIHVVSMGVLYLSPPKRSRSTKKMGPWEKVVWTVQYQGPGRHVKYKAVKKINMKTEMDSLKAYYDGRIKVARASEKQNLKAVKKIEVDKFKKRKYVKYLDPIKRPDWEEHDLKAELDLGIALSVEELIRSLGDEELRIKGEYEVAYMLPDIKGTPRNKMSLAILDRDIEGEYLICWAKENQKYIIPTQELVQMPSPYRR